MRSLARSLFILLALSLLPAHAFAQTAQKTGTGIISGHVAIGDKPAEGVVVIVVPGEPRPDRREVARAVTDYEGNYRLMGLPAGRFNVVPLAPTLVGPADNTYGGSGRFLILGEGETVEKIDFNMARAGVITGRVTDADGRPVVEERLQLTPVDNPARGRFGGFYNPYMYQTDDRGVYRLYGIPAGRYTLSVGVSPDESMVRGGVVKRGYYPRTFYPGETDSKKAGIIEVTEGGEAKDINIRLGRQSQSFTVRGRVVSADGGSPVPNLIIGYGGYDPQQKVISAYSYGQYRTNARGEFKVDGVVPGRFAAFVWSENENYSDPVMFEVTDADVSGVEIKLKRGATITGRIQLEGTTDKKIMAHLTKIILGASVQTASLGPPETRQATIEPDGSFRLTGLPPGRAQLVMFDMQSQKNIRLLRIERDGAPLPNNIIEITPGAEVVNIRVIFEYGSGTILGQVRLENGTLTEGARLFVSVLKAGDDENSQPVTYAQADARGRFIIDGLVAGEYQVIVQAQIPSPAGQAKFVRGKQGVTVSNGAETEATITLDMSEGKEQ
ncbi:MAG TPA: carboxypeptidase-like regulatory domain-containing protein [Pyrinomonadaceae bacterium]|nr:carboxypeptidase-like regulatory domain-containing protein [Pyrinomonadaceae bacterium]